ncbi:MAG TPA: NusG domain II-containing protein [Thermotogota bacterium]|nr:NusG domain II-containing protein [Thermotogota bacterium]HRW34236.1 NusG domain II-containing protein [Thermotogota bacterium]
MPHFIMSVELNELKLFRKRDWIVYLLLFVLIGVTVYTGMAASKGTIVRVSVNGQMRYRFSLDQEGQHVIECNGKKLMELLIADSDAKIIHSACPLHLCERGTLKQSGALVCVPQKVIIVLEQNGEAVEISDEYDLITG